MILKYNEFVNESLLTEGSYGDEVYANDAADDIVMYIIREKFKDVEKVD